MLIHLRPCSGSRAFIVNITSCGSTFARLPQKILIGYAQVVYNAPTLGSCLRKCLETTQPLAEFNCASVQYYYKDHQCILNSETKNKYPDLFISESTSEDEVDYVENNCYAGECGFPIEHAVPK